MRESARILGDSSSGESTCDGLLCAQTSLEKHEFPSKWKSIDNKAHDYMEWYKFKRISRWIGDWEPQSSTILPLKPWCYLKPFENTYQMYPKDKLETKNTWIDWEALNQMNEFTSDGLRLNIFTLEEMRDARKRVLSSTKQSTILFCGNVHLWSEIYMCYLYNEDGKNSLGCIGQEYINRETVFHWTCCQCKNKNILETLKAGEL